jgi:eukaryotic-like serine/threonine-protein kinase
MMPERWDRVEEICQAALQVSRVDRDAFLRRACGADQTLLVEVREILSGIEDDPTFLEVPLVEFGATDVGDGTTDSWIGPYRIVRPLGRGGMGDVYLCVRELEGAAVPVAVKRLRRGMDSTEALRRFSRERHILANLRHPGIARLVDGGVSQDGGAYLAMEFVEGEPIDDYCDRHRLDVAERVHLVRKVCAAVQHAHTNLVVHRDLKPSNILVGEDGEPKLLDFGVSKLLGSDESPSDATGLDVRAYTPEYASPEQVLHRPVTAAADIHGLGLLLFELLTGRHPFATGSRAIDEVERAITTEDPLRPSSVVERPGSRSRRAEPPLPLDPVVLAARRATTPAGLSWRLRGDLDTIVLTALRKEPDRRYSTASAFADDLRRHLTGYPVAARPDTKAYRASRFVSRNRWPLTAATVAVVTLSGAAVQSTLQSRRLATERDAALEVRGFLLESFGARGADASVPASARELLDQQAVTLSYAYGDRPALHAEMLHVLAEGYERLGQYEPAERSAREAIELLRELEEGDPVGVASATALLGWIRRQQGALTEADSLLSGAVSSLRREGSPGVRALARALNDLGVVRQQAGDLDGAAPALAEALELRRRHFPQELRAIGITSSNLAALEYVRGNPGRAAERQGEALDALRSTSGPDHQRSLIAQSNLATMRLAAGDLAAAEDELRDLVDRQIRTQGPDHPVTTRTKVTLGVALGRQARWAEAEMVIREAMEAQERTLGREHPQVAVTARSLTDVLISLGRENDAAELARRAIGITTAAYGPGHVDVGEAISALARAQVAAGDHLSGAASHRKALAIFLELLGPDHPRVAAETRRLDALVISR